MELHVDEIEFGSNKNFTMRNEITLNINNLASEEFYENELVEVYSLEKKFYAVITYQTHNSKLKAHISKELKKLIQHNIVIKKIEHISIKNYSVARITNLQHNKIEISKNILERLTTNSVDKIIIVNNFNGFRLDLTLEDFVVDEENNDIIRFGIKHRRLLDLELPTYIADYYINKLDPSIKKYYQSERNNVKYDNYYEAASEFKKIYSSNNIDIISLYPYNESKKETLSSKLLKKLSNLRFYLLQIIIGQRKIYLRAVRPYPLDESENTVRISDTVMKLLGLEESDNVIIRNGKYFVSAKVMKIDKFSDLLQENRIKSEQDLDVLIGIPAYMRVLLNLDYINYSVSVERDLEYLFKKNLNNQIMTIIGVFGSLYFLNEINNIHLKAIAFICVVFLLVYISFSRIREKIGKKILKGNK